MLKTSENHYYSKKKKERCLSLSSSKYLWQSMFTTVYRFYVMFLYYLIVSSIAPSVNSLLISRLVVFIDWYALCWSAGVKFFLRPSIHDRLHMVEKHACSYDFCDVFTGILELAFTAEFDNLHMIFYIFFWEAFKRNEKFGVQFLK